MAAFWLLSAVTAVQAADPADTGLVDIPMPEASFTLPEELQALPPIPTLNAVAPANPVLADDPQRPLGWLTRLKNRLLGRNEFETEPTIRVTVSGAPEPLAQNVRASLQRITVEDVRVDAHQTGLASGPTAGGLVVTLPAKYGGQTARIKVLASYLYEKGLATKSDYGLVSATAVVMPRGIIWSASTDSLGSTSCFSRSRTSLNTRSSWPW